MLQDLALALAKNGEHAIAEGKLLDAIAEMKKLDNAGTVHRVRPRLSRASTVVHR